MRDPQQTTTIRGLPQQLADIERCLVMGILNVTPDSFSDGHRWLEPELAIRHGLDLVEQGADIVDVGGESTRPGAGRIDAEEELRRVLPVISALAKAGVLVSTDTVRAVTARAAIEAGACIVNDVSGGKVDPAMAPMVASYGVPYILMHWRGPSDVMDSLTSYHDVVYDVRSELAEQLDRVVGAGVAPDSVILDPGFGFAKNAEQNWALLSELPELKQLGRPVMVGTARKRFLAQAVTRGRLQTGAAPGPLDREAATAATSVIAALAGAWAVRVHDVSASADAVRVVAMTAAAKIGREDRGCDPNVHLGEAK